MRPLIVGNVLVPRIAGPEPTSAIVSYESSRVDAHGVTHTLRYRDRIVRDDVNVWTARLLPWPEPRVERAKDLDLAIAARWYTRTAAGLSVALVSPINRVVIHVTPDRHASLGLVARWEDLPDPRRMTRTIVQLERATRAPWLAVTDEFRIVDLAELAG